MCGRYRLTAKERWLSQYFNLDPEDVAWAARWNIAPTQEVATIRQDCDEPKRLFALMRWGLIPYWAKDASIASRTINAMSETVAEKPALTAPVQPAFRCCFCAYARPICSGSAMALVNA